jgi:hypothetical protein
MASRNLCCLATLTVACVQSFANDHASWLTHDRTRPQPPVVKPGEQRAQVLASTAPSDATVLFDGDDAFAWVADDGAPVPWEVRDGTLVTKPGSGSVRTLQSFGDCQLHVEWMVPRAAEGVRQATGNSGVMLGGGRYEIQLLNSYGTSSYADGLAAAVYGQHPPLVNASRAPGEWQSLDIVWTAPRFGPDGKLLSPARLTLLHNGVLVQNNKELMGPTTWISRLPYISHPERLPIVLQDHGSPLHFRNIWVRELVKHRYPEFRLPDALLESYAGTYGTGKWTSVRIGRLPEGLLSLTLGDAEVVLHAASPTHFYAMLADVQCRFDFSDGKKRVLVTVGVEFDRATVMERAEP